MLIGIIIGILTWQLVSFITYVVFDNESENVICGGVFAIIVLTVCKVVRLVRRKRNLRPGNRRKK